MLAMVLAKEKLCMSAMHQYSVTAMDVSSDSVRITAACGV